MIEKIYHEIGKGGESLSLELRHDILVEAADFKTGTAKVIRFFRDYQLVRYARIHLPEEKCLIATGAGFWGRLKEGEERNREEVRKLMKELGQEGVRTLTELEALPQGYQSKTLHTLAHFLDGFFGIDSYFFNLVEDSHWLSDDLRRKIHSLPAAFMLLGIEAAT